MFAEVNSLIKDSIIITEDSSIYLHNIDLYTAAAVLAMDGKASLIFTSMILNPVKEEIDSILGMIQMRICLKISYLLHLASLEG